MIAQIFVSTTELLTPTGTQTNEANEEIETQPVTDETKISKFSNYLYVFLYFSFIKSLCFISSERSFLLILFIVS